MPLALAASVALALRPLGLRGLRALGLLRRALLALDVLAGGRPLLLTHLLGLRPLRLRLRLRAWLRLCSLGARAWLRLWLRCLLTRLPLLLPLLLRGLTLGLSLRLLLLTQCYTLALRALALGPVVRGLRHGLLRLRGCALLLTLLTS